MNFYLILSVFGVLFGCIHSSDEFSYEGYKLLSVSLKSQKDANIIQRLEANPDFDLWGSIKPQSDSVKVLLSPDALERYQKIFRLSNIDYEIIDDNIQEKIDDQKRTMKRSLEPKNIIGRFARYTEIVNFIYDTVDMYPEMATHYSAGLSYENRSIPVIAIKSPTSRRKIWIDCGIHAREWISPSTCVWIIDRLIKDYKSGVVDTVDLLNYYEFHIMPLVNPDGYEYSHTNTRLWRKNRRPNKNGNGCIGTDLNRNFGYQWSLPGGSSDQPCSEIYRGPEADSEPETKAVESAIAAHLGKWDAYLTLHTYGQYWFTPVGYTNQLPENYDRYLAKSKIGADAISRVNRSGVWQYGSGPALLYITTGSSDDWAYGVGNIEYSHCLELRPDDSGPDSKFGFTLPEDRAPSAGQETYVGIKAFLSSIKADALEK